MGVEDHFVRYRLCPGVFVNLRSWRKIRLLIIPVDDFLTPKNNVVRGSVDQSGSHDLARMDHVPRPVDVNRANLGDVKLLSSTHPIACEVKDHLGSVLFHDSKEFSGVGHVTAHIVNRNRRGVDVCICLKASAKCIHTNQRDVEQHDRIVMIVQKVQPKDLPAEPQSTSDKGSLRHAR